MIFKNRFKDYRRPMVLGMFCLVAFNLLNFSTRWIDAGWQNWMDGFAGFALGMAMVLILLAVRLRARQWRDEKTSPCA
jgi:hypothetical protein